MMLITVHTLKDDQDSPSLSVASSTVTAVIFLAVVDHVSLVSFFYLFPNKSTSELESSLSMSDAVVITDL